MKLGSYCLVAIVIAMLMFYQKEPVYTVVIAGAGIAFALQEVIMSVAGWIALTFGHFYKIGNRIQLAGITGDVCSTHLICRHIAVASNKECPLFDSEIR